MGKYPTPVVTRTYSDKEQRLAKSFFDAELRAQKLNPTPDEMVVVLAAAVSIFAYKAKKGSRSPFPSPQDFVDHYFEIDEEDPALGGENGLRATLMLKLAWKIHNQIKEQLTLGVTDNILATCPDCRRDTIDCHIGTLPCYHKGKLVPDDAPRLVALFLHCDCSGLGTAHFAQIEHEALFRWCRGIDHA